ncbi:hypothetical protein CCR75_002875 [Bremia lactucae]|uniref:Uncharacterized protein n=1 Tax=Bremia lactucae TaxID=4779 RepID=A0A976FMH8_BRELC|nr:hypothetical protein CCR75_002875 [Bremia lactucae]
MNNSADANNLLELKLQWSTNGDELRVSQHNHFRNLWNDVAHSSGTSEVNSRPSIKFLLGLAVISRPGIVTSVRIPPQETENPTEIVKQLQFKQELIFL